MVEKINQKIKKYKLYLNIIKYNLKNEFKEILNNLNIIFLNWKMIILFLFMLPITFYTVKIQIFVGVFYFFYYMFLFILYFNILKSTHIISCKETPINTSYIYRYSFFNIFIFVPMAKAFILVYNLLNIIINSNTNKLEKTTIIVIVFLISFFIKIHLFLFIGYSFLSILITSNLVISYFEIISWKYENFRAKMQHIIINCLLDNKDSVGKANDMRIIIQEKTITFNMKKFVDRFLSKTKQPEKFLRAFSPGNKEVFLKNFVDNHFSFSISSKTYANKNITKNYTSSDKIKVFNEKNIIENINCSDKSSPNLKGELKKNFLTRTYELNKEKTIIKEIPKNIQLNMQNASKNVHNSIISDKDKTVLYSENGKFYNKENSPTVKEYAKNCKIPIYEKIKDLSEYEEENKSYLESDEGKQEYEICKNIMRGNKYSDNDSAESDFD